MSIPDTTAEAKSAAAPSVAAGQRTRRIIAATLVALFVLVGVFAAGRLTAPRVGTPSTISAEAGFTRDMQIHHNQAVQMSMMIREQTDDSEVRLLAYDIATSQASQSGQLYGYLVEWNLPQAQAEPSMTWMARPTLDGDLHGHDGTEESTHNPGDPMPGLATPEQLATLASLSGVEAEREFLTLMIAHHIGGVEMAEALLDRSDYRSVTTLARGVVAAQTGEIDMMETLLAARTP